MPTHSSQLFSERDFNTETDRKQELIYLMPKPKYATKEALRKLGKKSYSHIFNLEININS